MNMLGALSSVFCRQVSVLIVQRSRLRNIHTAAVGGSLDDIIFTLMTSFPLHTFGLFWFDRLHSLRQFQQIHHSKQRPTRSHNDERIYRCSVGPTRWH
jgi:hypothetical protein